MTSSGKDFVFRLQSGQLRGLSIALGLQHTEISKGTEREMTCELKLRRLNEGN
jgi:hypothetical protein